MSEESFSHLSKLQVLDIGHGNISPNRGQAGEQVDEEEEELPYEEKEPKHSWVTDRKNPSKKSCPELSLTQK